MEGHYQTLLSTVPGVVYALDDTGRFTYLSDVLESILGYSHRELIGAHFSTVLFSEDVAEVSRRTVLPRFSGIATGSDRAPKLFDERRASPRKTSDLRVRLRARSMRNNGEEQILLCKVNAAGKYKKGSDGGTVFCGTVGIIFDVTPEECASIISNNKKRYSVVDLLSQALSHAFGNVFTGIYGNLQLIEMHLNGKEEVVANINAIKNSVEKAVGLIKQMRQTISEVSKEKRDLITLAQEVVEEVFTESKLECRFTTDSSLWDIEPDFDYIRHILRSVFYYIHHNVDGPGIIYINISNDHSEADGTLPRYDCKYLKVEILLPSNGLNRFHSAQAIMEGCNEALHKISTMALSYSLLKKIGAAIRVGNQENPSVILFIPAVHTLSLTTENNEA